MIPMATNGSVTHWLHQLEAGDPAAAQHLWERYVEKLVRLARRKLQGVPRRAEDEEDVALSAFDSFFKNFARKQFPQLHDRKNLWALLVRITERKAWDLAQRERRQKRGGGRVVDEAVLPGPADSSGPGCHLDQFAGYEPTPEFAAQAAENLRQLLDRLQNPELRQIAIWKMEGYTNREIAAKIGRAEVSVERRLDRIREVWEKVGV
jgi:RNA polymerase sigma factor (sigma-70 family)